MMEKLKELLNITNVNHITVPRRTLLLMHLVQFCLFFAVLFLWRGILIVFSLLLGVLTAIFTVIFLKIWRRYYSVLSFVLLSLLAAGCAVALYVILVKP
ncbi:MAG: hypothetical protein IJY12_00390 [Clostridia bacterium]|nr:hypothetical protein [Clostridia bacterium]